MQQDFLCSPINRQVGCKQYTSTVVGGPATTILPICSVFVCNDDCTTGDLTYEIDDLADFYGKRLVIIKTEDTTATGFKVKVISPSSQFVTTGSTTLDLPDLPSSTELIFPIGAGLEIGVTSYDAASGATINLYTADGTLTADRTVDCDDKRLIVVAADPGAFFAVCKQPVFPPVTGDDACVFMEPNDFQSSGFPAAGLGIVDDGTINDSASVLASHAPGVKSVMLISTTDSNNTNNMVLVTNSGVSVLTNTITDTAGLDVTPTGITVNGGSQQTLKLQNLPSDNTKDDIISIDLVDNRLYTRSISSLNSNALFAVSTTVGMTLQNLVFNLGIPASATSFAVVASARQYNNVGSDLDLTTGIYTPSETAYMNIAASFYIISSTNSGLGILNFYNITDNVILATTQYPIAATPVNNPPVNFTFNAQLESGKQYIWRYSSTVSAGTVGLHSGLWSINKI